MKPKPDSISVDEAAALVGLSRNALFAGAKRGEVPCRRVGRRVLWSRAALTQWLAHGCLGSDNELGVVR